MTRQVEGAWDDSARTVAEGLALHDRELCPGCGLHPVILDDPEHNTFTFEERLCAVCAGQEQYGRTLAKRDQEWEEAHKSADPKAHRPSDGRHTLMRPLTPEEAERVRSSRAERPTP